MIERINLSPAQQEVADKVIEWLGTDKQDLVIGGYAGTGKTTIGRWLQDEIGGASFCAYTGKAVNVLRRKGCLEVSTIHQAIYKMASKDRTPLKELEQQLEDAKSSNAMQSVTILEKKIEDLKEELAKPNWVPKNDGVKKFKIIDEFSMLDFKIVDDLRRQYKKILWFGDPYQLPPIADGGCPLKPDILLTEIHRQSENSPILKAATMLRMGKDLPLCDWGAFKFIKENDLTYDDMMSVDQVIVGKNKTRKFLNDWFRFNKGFSTAPNKLSFDDCLPKKGENMMCMVNEHTLGLFNGMEVTVLEDAIAHPSKDYAYLARFKGVGKAQGSLELNEDDKEKALECWMGQITGEEFKWSDLRLRGLRRFDFAYAITCHKSQGSEYDSIVVFNEPVQSGDLLREESYRRWLYTAITRGKNKVILVEQ